jgi:hypothetical protein
MTPAQIVTQIKNVIQKMIEVGLSNQQNYPVLTDTGPRANEIGIAGAPRLSVSMKKVPYRTIYEALDRSGAYHIRMIDGALLQMCYRFDKGTVIAHRLCMFPAPHLPNYDADPESYDKDELYADIVEEGIVHIPIRFDFDAANDRHIDVNHPKSHLTLGQYPNCRIPVSAPISPARFMKFILRNFYYTAFHAANLEGIDGAFKFQETLTANEGAITYLAG